jgi:hypothetical protein
MRKYILILAVALITAWGATPVFADVQFLYGGQFRVRAQDGNNVWDGTNTNGYYGNYAPQTNDALGKNNSYFNSIDHRMFIDQRLRLYFTFLGSPNLKVVTKFEVGDTKWGDPGDGAANVGIRAGQNGGGNIGADQVAVEVKNAYMEFNIPNTPSTGLIGIQTITLMDSWIIDDDFSSAVLLTKLDPFRVAVGYIGGQYGAERRLGTGTNTLPSSTTNGLSNTYMAYTNQDLNIDDVFVSVDYSCGPFKSSFVAFYQDGHKTTSSLDRTTMGTPVTWFTGVSDTGFMPVQANVKNNSLIDLGVNLTYRVDWLLAYINFVKNLGSVSYYNPVQLTTLTSPGVSGVNKALGQVSESDYEGWMVDMGATYFCPPFTFNAGGFYTTGPHFSDTVGNNGNGTGINTTSATNPVPTVGGLPFRGTTDTNVTWFTGPVGTSKYSSEILGGGVLMDDNWVQRGFANGLSAAKMSFSTSASSLSTVYWETFQYPTNVWTVTTGASWQICPGTKLSASYWYWGTSNPVPVSFDTSSFKAAGVVPATGFVGNPGNLKYNMSSSIGNEFDLYLDQQVVDNLTLTLVAAYLLADDAFCPLPVPSTSTLYAFGSGSTQINPSLYTSPQASNAYKFGARLQWNF